MPIVLEVEFDPKDNLFVVSIQADAIHHVERITVNYFYHICQTIARSFNSPFPNLQMQRLSKRARRGVVSYFNSVLQKYQRTCG